MMKNKGIPVLLIFFFAALLFGCGSSDSSDVRTGFGESTLRMDYLQTGNKETSSVQFLCWKAEPYWGGPQKNLIPDPVKGDFILQVFDAAGNTLLYVNGYSSLFWEWQTTEEAETSTRTFHESVIMPFPLQTVRIRLQRRNKFQEFSTIFETVFDPVTSEIQTSNSFNQTAGDNGVQSGYPVEEVRHSGDPAQSIDLVFLPEGYTETEMEKFRQDVIKITDAMFSWSPFNEYVDQFNIWVVYAPSEESGTDLPQDGIYKDTILNSTFNTFGIDRYLTTSDYEAVRDLASNAPYDQICIIVNHDKYGGCGIYNFYSIFTADNEWTDFLFMHEFGHAFAALADEYFSSEVPNNELFDTSVEPYQENITTLVDFESKWADMVEPGVPIPTPDDPIYYDKVGVFEGAAYQAIGMYRPFYDCTMNSKSIDNFCPVCRRAIRRTMDWQRDMVSD